MPKGIASWTFDSDGNFLEELVAVSNKKDFWKVNQLKLRDFSTKNGYTLRPLNSVFKFDISVREGGSTPQKRVFSSSTARFKMCVDNALKCILVMSCGRPQRVILQVDGG